MTPDQAPLLVVVTGAAASGKTTLARLIADELRLPLLSRDDFKESLMDALGSPDRARSRELGVASYALLFMTLNRVLAAGIGAVVESNFTRSLAERDFLPFLSRAYLVQVHCHAPLDETRRRYRARAIGGERHPGHHDADPVTQADFETSLTSGRHQPLDLNCPTITVDTTAGYVPTFAAIIAIIRNVPSAQ